MSASPVTPLVTAALLLDTNAPLCDKLKALLSAGTVLNDLVTYMFDNNGNPTEGFIGAIGMKLMPVGAMMFWPAPSLPSGFLIANGQAVDRVTYASLFALYGTSHGAGNGTTTFNLPNMENRLPMGASAGKGAGSTGGATDNKIVLTVPQLPAHTHTWDGPSTRNEERGGGADLCWRGSQDAETEATGEGAQVDITPAYLAGYWIIRF